MQLYIVQNISGASASFEQWSQGSPFSSLDLKMEVFALPFGDIVRHFSSVPGSEVIYTSEGAYIKRRDGLFVIKLIEVIE